MDNINELELKLDNFEFYILNNINHDISICKKYESKINTIIQELELEGINIYYYIIRLRNLIKMVNIF